MPPSGQRTYPRWRVWPCPARPPPARRARGSSRRRSAAPWPDAGSARGDALLAARRSWWAPTGGTRTRARRLHRLPC